MKKENKEEEPKEKVVTSQRQFGRRNLYQNIKEKEVKIALKVGL